MKKVILTGGTGSLGSKLKQHLEKTGVKVFVLTRNPKTDDEFYWNLKTGELDCPPLFEADTIIHLAGAGIADKRWTESRKKVLLDSRVAGLQLLKKELQRKENKLEFLISASGINVYPLSKNSKKYYSEDGEHGETFIAELVEKWEAAALEFNNLCKVGILRIPAVMMKSEGMLKPLEKITRTNLSSPVGSGKQALPWVHIDDLIRVFNWMGTSRQGGIFNANANNTNNADFMRELAKQMGKKFFMPRVPSWLLGLFFGEMGSLITKGCYADNSKIKNAGFTFNYANLDKALAHLYR